MSKTTFAVIAALGAGTGAAVTAAMYSLRSGRQVDKAPVPAVSNAPTSAKRGSSAAVPASQVFAPLPPFPSSPTVSAVGARGSESSPVDPAGIFQYGFPGPVADMAVRSALVSAYDRRLRNPHWVAEHITPESLSQRSGDRKHSVFVEDTAVPTAFRAQLRDYFRSGYDRGHQVPAADARWSQTAMDETFFLTNMCPQVGDGFNRDYWAHFEDFVRRLATRYPSVRVVTGPLYLPKRDPADNKWYVRYEVIGGPPSVAVPTHFYKVIFAEAAPADTTSGPVAVGAFVLPNAPIPNEKPLADFEVPLEVVERASGLEFASKLSPQRRRRLCAETNCSLVVREFNNRQGTPARGGSSEGQRSRSRSPSPSPSV